MSWATMSKAERREAVASGAAAGESASRLARRFDTAIGAIEALAERAGITFEEQRANVLSQREAGPVEHEPGGQATAQHLGRDCRESSAPSFQSIEDSPGGAIEKVGGVAGACSALVSRREPDKGREAAPMPSPGLSTRRRPDRSPWTPERLECAEAMWREGESATRIAEVLGAVSRSAVLGQAHRNGWPMRSSSNGSAPTRKPVAPKIRPPRPTSAAVVRPAVPPPPPRPARSSAPLPRTDLEQPASLSVPLLELTLDQCKFYDGERDDPAKTFCGQKAWERTLRGERRVGPWCEYHARICYQPIALRTPRGEA